MNTDMRRRLLAPLVRGFVICLLGSPVVASAAAISESEPNDTWKSPQQVSVPAEGLSISGVIGQLGNDWNTDVDFFTFEGTEGDTPGISTIGACPGFPSNLVLYDAWGNIRGSAAGNCEDGIEALMNAVTLPGTGTYILGVSSWSHTFLENGVVENLDGQTPGGTYQLVIAGVHNPTPVPPPQNPPPPPPQDTPPQDTPPQDPPPPPPPQDPPPQLPPPSSARHVPIEVRHWHQDERDLGRRNGMDPITVVVLSMSRFDAMAVDPNSLTFGATGNEKSLYRCRKEAVDVNRDRRPDLVCYFKPDVANFKAGDLNGVLKGKTKAGEKIEGSAALKIFSRKPHKQPHRRSK
ncbi:MAG: PPC domain-containing protein [Burkholderiales bacterium]